MALDIQHTVQCLPSATIQQWCSAPHQFPEDASPGMVVQSHSLVEF